MERTDVLDPGVDVHWHTNLGLVRNGFDAFANLTHGTPGRQNSPRLDLIDIPEGRTALSHPMGEPIELEIAAKRSGVRIPTFGTWCSSVQEFQRRSMFCGACQRQRACS